MPNDPESQPTPSQAAKTIAQAAVEAARTPPTEGPPAVPPQAPAPTPAATPPVPAPVHGDQQGQEPTPPAQPDTTAQAAAAAAEGEDNQGTVNAEDVAAQAAAAGVPFEDVVEQLADWGIGVHIDEIPQESYEAVDHVLRSIRDGVNPLMREVEESRASADAIAQFRDRLANNPESILLPLAVNKPEVFKEVQNIVERMEEDEGFKRDVLHRIDVERREAQLNARESQAVQTEMATKSRRAIAMTQRAAARHGVPYENAERYVAAMVESVGREKFDLNTIDSLVAELRPAQPKKPMPKTVTPQQVTQQQQAPQGPTGGAAPPSAPPAPTTAPNTGGGTLAAVRAAASRARQSLSGG